MWGGGGGGGGGGGAHMCMGRNVCVCGGGGGYTHMCMDVRAACVCLWDGVGVHAHVLYCIVLYLFKRILQKQMDAYHGSLPHKYRKKNVCAQYSMCVCVR